MNILFLTAEMDLQNCELLDQAEKVVIVRLPNGMVAYPAIRNRCDCCSPLCLVTNHPFIQRQRRIILNLWKAGQKDVCKVI